MLLSVDFIIKIRANKIDVWKLFIYLVHSFIVLFQRDREISPLKDSLQLK